MRTQLVLALAVVAACHGGKPPAPVPPPSPPPVDKPPVAAMPDTPSADPGAGADPAPKTDGDTSEAWIHGLHVIVRRIPGAEATATQLYIRGGARNWDAKTAGIEQLAVRASLDGGTESRSRDVFTQALSDLGSTIEGYAAVDWSVMYAWSLTPAWDATFALLVDVFRRPALPDKIVEVTRAQQLAQINSELDDPDQALTILQVSTLYAGQPYANRPIGNAAAVSGFTIEQLRAHLAKLRVTSRLVLLVVGDVDAQHVFDATTRALGDLPRGDYREATIPAFAHAAPALTTVAKKLPTNYIRAVFAGPTWKEPDQLAIGSVFATVLHDREFTEVRTKRNLSYAPQAGFSAANDVPYGSLYVTAVDPVTTMKVMIAEAKRMRDEPVPDKELASAKAQLTTGLAAARESVNDAATQMAYSELRGGDWRLSRTALARVNAVTSAQLQDWAKRYVTKLQTFVVGDPAKIDKATLDAL